MPEKTVYDVFISYSHRDAKWVREWLLPRLEDAGLRVCIDFRDFDIGVPSLINMEQAVERSLKTLLVLTPDWTKSEWTNFEALMVQTDDPIGRRRRVLPLMLADCEPPKRIGIFTYADFKRRELWESQLNRVIDAIRKKGTWQEALGSAAVTVLPLPPQPYFAHPYPLQENFTGRVRERRMLTEWVSEDDRPVLVLEAMGGMGKSALTWAWLQRDVLGLPLPGVPADAAEACRVPDDARPEGVLWWSFYERAGAFATFVDKALTYVSRGEVEPATIPSTYERVEALVNLLQQRRILLVLDGFERELRAYASLSAAYQGDFVAEAGRGADDLACTDPHPAQFLRGVASLPLQGQVLLTSRLFPRELEGLAGCRKEELTGLDPDDAVAFFHAQGVKKGTRAEIEAACRPYGYLPLALRLLAGVIVRDKQMPGDIQVAERYPILAELKGKEQHHILEVSYEALEPRKRTLLSRIAAFRSPMSYDAVSVLNAYKGRKAFDTALDELVDRGLLQYDGATERYDLHPIVRGHAYDRLRDRKGVHTRLRDYFADVPAPDEVKSVDDLAPVIELYHHTVRAGRYDEARELYSDRLVDPLYFRFGAYQTEIDLLRGLFPDGEEQPPRLKREGHQAWTLNSLANSYSMSGQPRRAVPLFEASNAIDERLGEEIGVAIGLGNLATQQVILGELAAAKESLRRRIALCKDIGDEFWEAVGHRDRGWLLGYEGGFEEAARELDTALELVPKHSEIQSQCVLWAYRGVRALLMADARQALGAARQARELADETARTHYPYEADFVRAEWLIGWALVALASEDESERTERLAEAEGHLTEALTRCRRINLVQFEPDILVACARWHRASGNAQQARHHAEEGLAIADRCEYRLVQADAHNFLSRLALDEGKTEDAREQAEIAKERAWCDGDPHWYKPALEEAERLLEEAGSGA